MQMLGTEYYLVADRMDCWYNCPRSVVPPLTAFDAHRRQAKCIKCVFYFLGFSLSTISRMPELLFGTRARLTLGTLTSHTVRRAPFFLTFKAETFSATINR